MVSTLVKSIVLVSFLVLGGTKRGAAEERPNIVLFLVDDMGWMDSPVYGSQYYEAPNMERLAKQAMMFTDAYAVPLCSPSRATILSGQYSARHGLTSASGHRPAAKQGASRYPEKTGAKSRYIYPTSKNYLNPDIPNLARVLKQAGYHTGHFGKWHLGIAPEHRPDQQGFESTWFCVPDPGPPSYFSPYQVKTEGHPTAQNRIGNITDGPDGEYITDRLTDEAIGFLEANRDEPFFLNLWQYGVHGPWGHKEEYTEMFAKKTDPRGQQRNPIMASMLKSVDDSLGRILDKLDELQLTQKTLFIFYSDNGGNTHSNIPGSRQETAIKPGHPKYAQMVDWKKWAGPEPPTNNAPLREGKGRIYEGGQRVPLMVRWPGRIEAGTENHTVVTAVDLYPTILEATGVTPPKGHIMDGLSLLPVLQDTGKLERQAIYTWFPHLIPAASVRAGDWKLIYRWEPHPLYPEIRELYNLSEDIGEKNNLASKHPEKVAELEKLIEAFIVDTGTPAPKPNPDYREPAQQKAKSPETGLVPKMAKMTVTANSLRVEKAGKFPFLGTAQVKNLTGPLTLEMTMSGSSGESRVQWKSNGQTAFPEQGQSVTYTVSDAEGMQNITLELPVKGNAGILRIYLPATDDSPVNIESIVVKGSKGKSTQWHFAGKEKP
ncbi:MAG: sulfatase [Verrucomicrobiales bacterium]|nr:sulfatase [Verrucomicrobiales bacterium]